MYNELVRIIKNDKISKEDKNKAKMLLNQLTTASGAYFLKKEIQYFIEEIDEKYH